MDDDEVKGLRTYLLKGGFMIFDDFRARDWDNLEDQMRLAFPTGSWIELDPRSRCSTRSSRSRIRIRWCSVVWRRCRLYYGLFENNDRERRLMAVANVNNDLGEYWEFSDTGYAPVDLSNEAYKFGVNYFIYGLTH